jgi:predicted transcriptional regulator
MGRPKEFEKTLKVRLSEDQSDKLEALAEASDSDKSEIIRNHIDSLPDIRKKDKES